MTGGAVAIILAAGSGERLGRAKPKAFLEVGGAPMVLRAAEAAAACSGVTSIVIAAASGLEERAGALVVVGKPVVVVAGGATRHRSVGLALAAIPEPTGVIVCHDAARPFASPRLFAEVLDALESSADTSGAVPVVLVSDTVKRVHGGFVVATEDRDELALAQTPQAFRAPALRDAHARAVRAGLEFSDDAAALEWVGYRVVAIPGDPDNFKITTERDLARAELVAAERARG